MKKVLSYFEKLFENDNEKQKKCFFRLGFPTLPEKYIQRSEMVRIFKENLLKLCNSN